MGGKSELILISCAEVRGAGNINYSYVDKLQAGAELCQAQVNYVYGALDSFKFSNSDRITKQGGG